MKNHNLRLCLYLIILCFGLLNCKESTTNSKAETNATAESNSTEIQSSVAKNRIEQYNAIYGNTGIRYLEGTDDKKVILPRYFIVNSAQYSNLLEDRDSVLYASLNVKMQNDSLVTNLIFHDLQPWPDGRLKKPDNYYDLVKTCPTACDYSNFSTGYLSAPVGSTEASQRIEAYNSIYGQGVETVRYMKSNNDQDSVLIPRYYSFNVSDMQGLLAALEANNQQFFYISMGAVAQVNSEGQILANSYISDLIFHCVRPNSAGLLVTPLASSDVFFDVTRPCPNSCDYI